MVALSLTRKRSISHLAPPCWVRRKRSVNVYFNKCTLLLSNRRGFEIDANFCNALYSHLTCFCNFGSILSSSSSCISKLFIYIFSSPFKFQRTKLNLSLKTNSIIASNWEYSRYSFKSFTYCVAASQIFIGYRKQTAIILIHPKV